MSAWMWGWRISPDELRAMIASGGYSHHERGLEVTATLDSMGGVEVKVVVTPEPLGDGGPR